MSYAAARDRRLAGVLAAAGAQALLALLIIRGLAAQYLEQPPQQADTAVVALPQLAPQPKPPPPPASDQPSGKGAPPAMAAKPRPREAPPPKLVIAPPRAAATQAGSGTAEQSGLAPVAGPGSGRGGSGSGPGSASGGIAAGAGVATPPQRIAGNLGDRDYPRSAAARGAAGTVAISFRIGRDGKVSGCAVIGSSGDAELDRLTCALVERRFVYRPARSPAGEPVETTLRTTFTWGTYRR